MSTIQRVKTDSLRTQVYVQIKKQLVEGVWKPGEKLPSENQLCALFGVSRVTVRAALQQLEILGLVETKHGGGTYVKDFSSLDAIDTLHPFMQLSRNQDIITVLEYRKIIEKGAIALAVKKINAGDFVSLEALYAAMVSAHQARDEVSFAKADHEFHCRIMELAKNPIVLRVYGMINELLTAAMSDIVSQLGFEIGLRYHRKIIDALRTGDSALCESVMDAHIEETIAAIAAAAAKKA